MTIYISTNGKQEVLKQPEAINTDLLYFSALSYYKSSADICYRIFALGLDVALAKCQRATIQNKY